MSVLMQSETLALAQKAIQIRKLTLDAIAHLGVGHVGGCMSVVDILTLLYHRHMAVDPANPKLPTRDRLVLSKGHAGPALYSVLADKGFFPVEWLHTLNKGGTNLPSHCDKNKTPGIDMTTGSLGQGISSAIGMAMALKQDSRDSRVYLIIGDGETNEGQIWEGAMAAAHFKLNNLIAFTDYNKMQIDGFSHDVMNLDDLGAKWAAFGWFVQRVNGHDFYDMEMAISRAKAETLRPSMIILDTIKGKGVPMAEHNLANHNMKFDQAALADANTHLDSIWN